MTPSEVGRRGETAVCQYLLQRGYTIRKRNYRIRGGEIDIIAQKDEILAFVEVKSRRQSEGFPLEYLSPQQQLRIVKASLQYCAAENPDWALQPRYDAADVVTERGQIVSIEYVENAFDASGLDAIR